MLLTVLHIGLAPRIDIWLFNRAKKAVTRKILEFKRIDEKGLHDCFYPYLIDLDMLASACKLNMNIYKDDVEAFRKWKSKRFAKCAKRGAKRKIP